MSREEELFEMVKLLNKQNIEIYEKYCNLLKAKKEDDFEQNIQLMRATVHNKILLMVILSKLGMEDAEIDKLNVDIYNALDKEIDNFGKENEKDENNGIDS
jgi:hypothetical protein